MKKMTIALAVICTLLFANLNKTIAAPVYGAPTPGLSSAHGDWMKSKDGTWPGKMDGKTYWYKLDKSANLWWSTDGKKWMEVKDDMWADKDGKWLKVDNSKLVWSNDMGKSWNEVPDWTWQGSDGNWYKFDKDWSLWVKK